MKARAYYNEFDPQAAAWLRELIKGGHIADGDVDERSIVDVRPGDLAGYTQCHFFAGIGVWSYALRQAGWSDDRPVWTGSCPCQPFSAAGKGAGFTDERHLWPYFHYFISQRRPSVVFGEQVASKDGLAWFDLVQSDMEGTGYACGAVDTCAAGFGAPHIRQRLYWVAERQGVGLADADGAGLEGRGRTERGEFGQDGPADALRSDGRLANASDSSRQREIAWPVERVIPQSFGAVQAKPQSASPTNGFWGPADWLYCRDEKWRPVEPGTFPLAHGPAARVGRLRGYGNAIVAPQAQAFVEAYLDVCAVREAEHA